MNAVYNEAPNAQLIHATASEVMHSRMGEQETVRQAEQHVHQIHSEAAQAVNQIRTEATQAVTAAFMNSQSQVSRTQLEATQHVAELQSQFQAREHEFMSQVQRLQKEADDSRRETESTRFKSQNASATNEGSLQSKIAYLHGNMCRIDKELQEQKSMLSQFMESFKLLGERIDQLDQWYEEPQPPADNDEELIPTKQNSRSLISLLVPKDFSRRLVQW
jgi:myosin heavy subunit